MALQDRRNAFPNKKLDPYIFLLTSSLRYTSIRALMRHSSFRNVSVLVVPNATATRIKKRHVFFSLSFSEEGNRNTQLRGTSKDAIGSIKKTRTGRFARLQSQHSSETSPHSAPIRSIKDFQSARQKANVCVNGLF